MGINIPFLDLHLEVVYEPEVFFSGYLMDGVDSRLQFFGLAITVLICANGSYCSSFCIFDFKSSVFLRTTDLVTVK